MRIGTDNDFKAAERLVVEWRDKVDALGLGLVHDHYWVGTHYFRQRDTAKLEKLAGDTLVSTGARLREIVQEWSLRSAQQELSSFFNNAKVLFLSGTTNYRLASVMGEFTQNLSFADPVLQFGAPGLLHSLRALERYAAGSDPVLRFGPEGRVLPSLAPAKQLNKALLKKAVRDADVIVGGYHQLERYGPDELDGKVELTSTISPDRQQALKERGVRVVIDCSIQLFEQTVGLNIIEAMILAALGKPAKEIAHDDYLEIFTDLDLKPRILYPIEGKKQVNRFAFVIHPLSQKYLTNLKPLDPLVGGTASIGDVESALERLGGRRPEVVSVAPNTLSEVWASIGAVARGFRGPP